MKFISIGGNAPDVLPEVSILAVGFRVANYAQPATDFHRDRLRIRLTTVNDRNIFTPD
jgi:hypothetical protein